jgi:hypothetical protein
MLSVFNCTPGHEDIRAVEVQLHALLKSALDGGGWSASRRGYFIPGGKPLASHRGQGPITHSLKELSPSWEAAHYAATQEILSILRNP